jgi:hypothetical protein
VAGILRARARKSGQFSTLEDVDFSDAVERAGLKVSPETDVDDIQTFAQRFRASFVVWGEVTADKDTYLISARILRLKPGAEPEALARSVPAQGPQNVPAACETILGLILKPEPVKSNEAETKAMEQAWKTSPNLCKNGDFERGDKLPEAWRVVRSDCVAHVSRADSPDRDGKCLRYDMPESVAANQGIMTYSAPIPVEVGATYRLQADILTRAPTLIFFVKGYAYVKGTEDEGFSWREVWQRKKTIVVEKGRWQPFTIDLHPGMDVFQKGEPMAIAHRIRFVRVGLYAYWPTGQVCWDNVVFKAVLPASEEFRRKVAAQAKADATEVPDLPNE